MGTNEDRMMKINLFFNDDINVKKYAKAGMSIGKLKNEKFMSETNNFYHFTKYGKAFLKFSRESLEPTPEFIKEVEDAIKSKDPENLGKLRRNLVNSFQLYILGGRAHFDDIRMLTKNS